MLSKIRGNSIYPFKEVLIHLFEVKHVFGSTANVILDHQFRELLTIDEDNPHTKVFCSLNSWGTKGCCSEKYSLLRFL